MLAYPKMLPVKFCQLLMGLVFVFVSGACEKLPTEPPTQIDEARHSIANHGIQQAMRRVARHPLKTRAVGSESYTHKLDSYFKKYSRRYFGPAVDWRWFKAQAIVESELKQGAKGPMGAIGVMQIMPDTFQDMESLFLLDADQERWHIAVGIKYDYWLWQMLAGEVPNQQRMAFMFASYNCGRSRLLQAMARCGGCTEWRAVQTFVPAITRRYLQKIYALMNRVP